MRTRMPSAGTLSILVAGAALAACGGNSKSKPSASAALPQGSEKVDLDPPISRSTSTTRTGR